MNRIILILLAFSLMNCDSSFEKNNSALEKNENLGEKNDFSEYTTSLDNIELPLSYTYNTKGNLPKLT